MRQIIYVVILFILPYPVYSQGLPDIEKLLEANDIESSESYYEDMVNTLVRLTRNIAGKHSCTKKIILPNNVLGLKARP